MKKLFLIAFSSLLFLVWVQAYAKEHHGDYSQGRHHEMWDSGEHHWLGIPNLTDAQKKQIEDAMMQMKQSLLSAKLEEKKKHIELSQLLLNPNVTRETIEAKIQEIDTVRHQKEEAMADVFFQISGFLTPQQRQAFAQVAAMHVSEEEHGFGPHEMMMTHGQQKGMKSPASHSKGH